MKRIRKWTAGALALILSLTLISPALADDGWDVSLSATFGQSDARSMLEMINAFRTGDEAYYWNQDNTAYVQSKGEPLVYSYALEEIAMQRAAEIALSFSHTRPDGTDCFTATASDGTASSGENIAAGTGSYLANSAFTGWREDDQNYSGQGHRRNMLDTSFKAVGIGHVTVGNAHYWVQEFSRMEDSAAETTPLDTAQDVTITIASGSLESADLTAAADSVSVAAGESVAAPVVSASVKVAEAWPNDRMTAVTVSPVWSSSDETVATVSGQQITGVNAGTATLTGAALGQTVSVPVTVTGGADPDNPVLALTKTVALNAQERFEGQIYKTDADITPTDYRVAIYIQLSEGGEAYYKPYNGAVLPSLNSVEAEDGYIMGTFSLAAYTDGGSANDLTAKYVHLMILPADENPKSSNYNEMLSKALEVVTVTRTEDGAITVEPQHEPKQPKLDTEGRDPQWPVSADKILLDVGFHTDGSAIGSGLSEEHIRRHLEKLVGFTEGVRFYDCSENLRPAYECAQQLGFQYVAATAYLTADDDANRAELDRAAALLNDGLASICAVGNETLENEVLSAEQLVEYIEYLRDKVTVDTAYITVADTVQALLKDENKAVRDNCDFLFMHAYPYYGSVDPDNQIPALRGDYNDLKAQNNNPKFQVYIGETGYPSEGAAMGNAVASEAEAARYFDEVRAWALNDEVRILFFSAFDEPAKTGDTAEKHFGLFDSNLKLKPAYGKLDAFQSMAATVYGNSLTLRGNIGVNFYLTLPEVLTTDADAYVTLNGKKYLIQDVTPGAVEDAPAGDYYKFTWTVPAKRMNDAVTLQVFTGQDIPYLLLDRNGIDHTDGYSYSVTDYLNQARQQNASGALRELVDAMSDYGSYAQTFFQYDADSAATPTDAIASVTAADFADYEPTVTTTDNSGISYAGSNLTLEAETTLRHFFKPESGHSVDEYAFTVDGVSVTPKFRSESEGYCVEIPDIVAKDLGKSYAVTVSPKDGGAEAVTITNYSALSYGYKALNGSSDDAALWNLVKALYLYNKKAEAYFTT